MMITSKFKFFAAAICLMGLAAGCSSQEGFNESSGGTDQGSIDSAPGNELVTSDTDSADLIQEDDFVLPDDLGVVIDHDRFLVWADEFDGSSLDQSIWSFDLGQFNDTLQYSTDRPENTIVEDGMLRLIALEESFQGYDYTASVIKTKHAVFWRYGRIEARIKLPGSPGFVPAFWLLPESDRYGWWPASGEIDIMEHPTNSVTTIFGTVHTEAFNLFTGSEPRGGTIEIPDAESNFHIYAVEWTPEKIDFMVDETVYFTYYNENEGGQTWPFDQPFYIVLNMAVGGGWVGDPNETTIFPAVMEVDYVRVYQYFDDIIVNGPDFVNPNQGSLIFSAPDVEGFEYLWQVPETAQITSGQSSSQITVDWGNQAGTVKLLLASDVGTRLIEHPVVMSSNLLFNADFELGTDYWNASVQFPAEAHFSLSTLESQAGSSSIYVEVDIPGANPWDIQLSQTNLAFEQGQSYSVTFWAKSDTNSDVTAAIIDAATFDLFAAESFQLTNTWTSYSFSFTAPADAIGSFNLDLGGHIGEYYIDNFQLIYSGTEP